MYKLIGYLANDPHTTSLALTKLQNPIREGLEAVHNDFLAVNKGQNKFGKALTAASSHDKIVKGSLPTDHDPMAAQPELVNRAIAMHLLREGKFGVASTFINEAQTQAPADATPQVRLPPPSSPLSQHIPPSYLSLKSPQALSPTQTDIDADTPIVDADGLTSELTEFQSQALQSSFAEMYAILSALKAQNLLPAITWARQNCAQLETRGSNLEFELCKLQFVWLFKGPELNGLPDTPDNGRTGALRYARANFGRFQHRHLREIQQLSCAMVYSSNLPMSPYRTIFDTNQAFDEVASSFTREFCSLLGLSAESPLYVAATAGIIALPQLMKFLKAVKGKGTEWTTKQELAFETPLPKSMVYHSIFVCPVSKEQTTDINPPMMLPCGHVLAHESLQRLAKSSRFKCPYCPSEGMIKDAREIIL
jgi:E3 ubiquitin-protein transferase RMND5